MGSAPAGRPFRVCCARIVAICRQEDRACCILANRARVYVPLFLAKHIATNDEITFPIPVEESTDAEMYIENAPPSRAKACLYLTAIRQVTQPKLDKRDQSFVSAKVRDGNLSISSVFLHCGIIRDYFYRTQAVEDGSERTNLYQTLRIAPSASPAEIRVAFKLRALELEMTGAARAEQAKLERAFNILGHPELRAHYDSLLANWELAAVFPYGGVGSLLVAGDRSPSGETFFARRILAFVPDQVHRRFHIRLRDCEFYADKALFHDARRKLQFWLDPALLRVTWDPSWNRWKHLLGAKIEVAGPLSRLQRAKHRRALEGRRVGKLGCPAGFGSRSRQTWSRMFRERDPCTADLASTLVLWIRYGYAWSTKQLSERNSRECALNWAFRVTSMSLRSIGARITMRSTTAHFSCALDVFISFVNTFSNLKKLLWSRRLSWGTLRTCSANLEIWKASWHCIPRSARTTFAIIVTT
jgi:hypothetical protein